MWLSFLRPEVLLLLPVAGGLLWYSARVSYADLRGTRRWLAWATRGLLVVALIFALAGAQLVKQSKNMVVVFALDASYSVSPEDHTKALEFVREALRHRRSGDRGALVLFGREAVVESESLRRPQDLEVTSKPAATHTNLAAGLRLALALVPPESAGRVVLLSDGNENIGSAAEESLLAQASHIAIEVVPLETRGAKDVLVRGVSVPSEARRGEPAPVRVTLEATAPAQATVTVLIDDKPTDRRDVTLAAGTTSLEMPVPMQESGFHKIDVLVDSGAEECRENDLGTAFVRVHGEPRVLIVDQNPSDAGALREGLELQDITVVTGGPAALPTNSVELEKFDTIVLSNYPAYRMDAQQMVMLRDATRDRGIGLGMIGGEYAFGAGGYYQTPIEEALPVSMDVTKHRAFPASAVLIVMDTSGSMAMEEDGVEKIQLAAEAACAVVDLLQPYDSAGFIASDPAPTMVCELRKVANKGAVKRDIRSVRAGGGGIAVYPSLSAAYDVLRKDESAIRHVILLADGSDCDEQQGSVPLAARMATERMTLTAVAFGDGPHVPFLKEVARGGRGQFYLTDRARDLKKIFTRETLTMTKSVVVEESFRPRVADSSAVIAGVEWPTAPPLLGYVATSPKPLARVPLVSHKEDPLFAHWQYGLGRSIAFTSDAKAHWAAHWLGWGGYPKFWSQAVRWTVRQLSSRVLYPRIEPQGDSARVVVEAVAEDGTLLNGLEVQGKVNLPDGTRKEVVLGQVAPGRYEATVATPVTGPYVVGLTALGPGGFEAHQTAGYAVAYPPDLADVRGNPGLLTTLAEQSGGRALVSPQEAFAPPKEVPRVRTDIWRALLWLAVLLLPLDVAVRRLVITREDLALFTEPLRAFAGRLVRRREITTPQTVGRLLARHKEARDRQPQPPPPIKPSGGEPSPASPVSRPTQQPQATPPPSPPADTLGHLLRKKHAKKD